MNRPSSCLVWIVFLTLFFNASAQQKDKRFAFSIFGGTAILQGDGSGGDMFPAGGASLKYSLANNFALRIQGFTGKMSTDKGDYISTTSFNEGNIQALLNIVNFKKQITGKNIAQLYVGFGVGYTMANLKYVYPDPATPKTNLNAVQSIIIPFTGGIRFYISPVIDLGLEYTVRGTFTDNFDGGAPPLSVSKSNDFYNLPQAYITFNFGGDKKARCLEWTEATEKLYEELVKAKQEAQQQIDALKKENASMVADMKKEIEMQMIENHRKSDSAIAAIKNSMKNDHDNDGVADLFDKEPNTPPDAIVDGSGRTLDVDKDGVPDYLDKCPTLPGKVSNNGCPLQPTKAQLATISDGIKNLQFETGNAIIKSSSFPALDALAQMLVENSSFAFLIEGHTDNVGKPADNMVLSIQRADAVKSYLVSKGVEAGRITSKGYGDTRPVVSNETAAGKAKNRRVDMTIE